MSSVQRLGNAGVSPQTNFQPTVAPAQRQDTQPKHQLQPQTSGTTDLNAALAARRGIENGVLT